MVRRPVEFVEGVVATLDSQGRGVLHLERGRVVHVSDALPAERVRVRLEGGRGRYRGEVEQILAPSPDRVSPRCAYFGICGGCALQHLRPERQAEIKQQVLLNALRENGLFPHEVFAPLTGRAWGYRRRARLAVKEVAAKGRILVGFRERQGRYVADMARCEVLDPLVGARLLQLSELLGSLDVRRRVPQVEVAIGDDLGALVFRVLDPPTERDRQRLLTFGEQHGFRIYLQSGGLQTATALNGGAQTLAYRLEDGTLELRFLPTDFVQVNAEVNRKVVDGVIELLQLGGVGSVLDLFCGIGNFTLPIGRRVAQVVGVDADRGLIARAAENAKRNEINNIRFVAADLGAAAPGASVWLRGYERVLLDPPRTGAAGVLTSLTRTGARRVVYLSCNPNTLARDAASLARGHGFRLAGVGVVDMFPHTAHIEAVAVFDR